MSEKLKSFYRYVSRKYQNIYLDYKVAPRPRYGHGHPAHSLLTKIIDGNRVQYEELLRDFLRHSQQLQAIKRSSEESDENKPSWNNGFLPGLDIVGIYGMLAHFKPVKYIEIGSGNSTKVARKAIEEQQLKTELISIDPFPRANIDHLADKVLRQPLEEISDLSFIIDGLEANDVLFIDNSHRVLPNSDAMVCFMELLPYLKKGVIVHIHDIYLPYDYPQFMCDRYYNEQYTLAAFILANPEKFETILPNYFISEDEKLSELIAPLWENDNLIGVERHGGSYWLRIN